MQLGASLGIIEGLDKGSGPVTHPEYLCTWCSIRKSRLMPLDSGKTEHSNHVVGGEIWIQERDIRGSGCTPQQQPSGQP
jgi:hypothetical protein